MNRSLQYPVKAQWDLPRHGDARGLNYRGLAAQLIECRVTSLSLRDLSFPSAAGMAVLDVLRNGPVAVSLTVADPSHPDDILRSLGGMEPERIYFELGTFEGLRRCIAEIKKIRKTGMPVGISFQVRPANFWDIPDIVLFAGINGIDTVTFPMQETLSGAPFFIRRDDRVELAIRLRNIDLASLHVNLNDPFLWRLCDPEGEFRQGGCQAGSDLIYLSPDGSVFPCPAMPYRIGSVAERALKDIVFSDSRQELIDRLAHPPQECSRCDDNLQCRGGCRGRAFASFRSFDRTDPACYQ